MNSQGYLKWHGGGLGGGLHGECREGLNLTEKEIKIKK